MNIQHMGTYTPLRYSDIEFGPESFGDFIIKLVTDRFILASLPYMLSFVTLDNAMMNKKKNS